DHDTPTDDLSEYRAKRSAARTPEPFGTSDHHGAGIFVVQKHAARRLHYDLRLEHEGVLLSWAVPAGPSMDTAIKRLAIRTEAHPLEYASFEGVIPDGEYGGGEMIVWDRGTYSAVEDIETGLESGKLWFDLNGYKLHGEWVLVRTKTNQGEWLLIKKPDGWDRAGGEDVFSEASIYTGRLVEQLKSDGAETELIAHLRQTGAVEFAVRIGEVRVMLAEVADAPFSREGWIFEIKYDGYRLVAEKRGVNVTLNYRSGIDATDVFPEIVVAMEALPYDHIVIDGEVVVLSLDGKPSFSGLQSRGSLTNLFEIAEASAASPATYFGFDLLAIEGLDCRTLPLHERKEALMQVLPSLGPIRYVDYIETIGKEMFKEVAAMGLEGIMAKRSSSVYSDGRSGDWLKIRSEQVGVFAIVGFVVREGNRNDLSAILLAARNGSELQYVGRVGSGFSEQVRRALLADLDTITIARTSVGSAPQDISDGSWVRPEVMCEVRYKEYTPSRNLRQPVFLAVLSDGQLNDVDLLEENGATPSTDDDVPVTTNSTVTFQPSNHEKVFWESEAITKGDLLAYYDSVAPHLLPFLEDRPIVLDRYPDGVSGKSFFQKNAPDHTPGWIRTEWIGETGSKGNRYFVCDDAASLAYIINSAAIPIHMWASTVSHPDAPDWCVLDLDPKEAEFLGVVTIARTIHDLCDQMGLPSYVKTSGKTGLHVLVPMGPRYSYDQQKLLGELIARVVEARLPDIATTIRSPARREGRVYIDYLQNGKGKLLVSPYSVRPVPGATVSTPLRWSEVTPSLDTTRFTIHSLPRRLAALKDDPLVAVLSDVPDISEGLTRLVDILDNAR
ncbi:MAG: DNA ligase D, partial [Proteobacteria bacterium]|nr:DNA ligase D [Pseudomonadota bacterium]